MIAKKIANRLSQRSNPEFGENKETLRTIDQLIAFWIEQNEDKFPKALQYVDILEEMKQSLGDPTTEIASGITQVHLDHPKAFDSLFNLLGDDRG